MKIVTSLPLPPPSPPPVFSSVPPSPTRTPLLVSLPHCTPSLSLWLVLACRRSLLTFFSTHSILTVLSSSLLFRTLHYFVQLSPGIWNHPLSSPLLLAFSLCRYRYPASHSHTCILSFSYWLSSLFSPKHISSSPVSLLRVPCSRFRSQCHRQTSWSMELPLWCHPSSYPSTLQTNKGSKLILDAAPPSPRTPPSLLPHTSPLLYCHHTYLVLFSRTSLPIHTFSCNTTPLLCTILHIYQ